MRGVIIDGRVGAGSTNTTLTWWGSVVADWLQNRLAPLLETHLGIESVERLRVVFAEHWQAGGDLAVTLARTRTAPDAE